jgi:hypothetical protein
VQQWLLAPQGKGSAVDGSGDREDAVEMIVFVLEQLGQITAETL